MKNVGSPSGKWWHVRCDCAQIIIHENIDITKAVGQGHSWVNGNFIGIVFCVSTANMSVINLTCSLEKTNSKSRRC